MRILALVSIGVLVCGSVSGAAAMTWRVEKDGSGDFTVIQDAVDAAADGDVIVIGPGRFDDFTTHTPGKVYVWLDGTKSLTFRGSGSGVTIIGPENYDDAFNIYGFACLDGAVELRFEDLRIEHIKGYGIRTEGSSVELIDCAIDHCRHGLFVLHGASHVTVLGSVFSHATDVTMSQAIYSVAVENLIAETEVIDYFAGMDFSVSGTQTYVTNCTITGSDGANSGISVQGGADAVVANCEFSGLYNHGIAIYHSGDVTIRDCHIHDCTGDGMDIYGADRLVMHDNVIERCASCLWIGGPCTIQDVHHNHFLRDEPNQGLYARTTTSYPYGPDYLDYTENYWGTTDPAIVSQWITDGYDLPDVQLYVVFEPMANGPVRTEQATWGAVKSLFHR